MAPALQLALSAASVAPIWEGEGLPQKEGPSPAAGVQLRHPHPAKTHLDSVHSIGMAEWGKEPIGSRPYSGFGSASVQPIVWIEMAIPEVTRIVHPSARPFLTDRVIAVLNPLLDFLEQEARRDYVSTDKLEVAGFADPEEDNAEVVITQWVKVRPEDALDYWERLGARIEVWISSLPGALQDVAAERVAVELRWDADAAAV